MKPEQFKSDQEEFAAAYDEEVASAAEPSDDEVFGLNLDEAVEESGGSDDAILIVADGDALEEAVMDDVAEASAKEAADSASPEAAEVVAEDERLESIGDVAEGGEVEATATDMPVEVDIAKETQRLKSWEGRLRKREEELKAQAERSGQSESEVVADALDDVTDATEDPELAAAAGDLAQQVEDGTISPQEATRQLSEDFGEDFVRMIEVITAAKASEIAGRGGDDRVARLEGDLTQVIDHIRNRETRDHFRAIADAHPDFDEVGKSDEFQAYIAGLPEGEREQAQRTADGGPAADVIALLDSYKAARAPVQEAPAPAVDEVDEGALDEAEGVRSRGGMSLPREPAASDDYEGAWEEFA